MIAGGAVLVVLALVVVPGEVSLGLRCSRYPTGRALVPSTVTITIIGCKPISGLPVDFAAQQHIPHFFLAIRTPALFRLIMFSFGIISLSSEDPEPIFPPIPTLPPHNSVPSLPPRKTPRPSRTSGTTFFSFQEDPQTVPYQWDHISSQEDSQTVAYQWDHIKISKIEEGAKTPFETRDTILQIGFEEQDANGFTKYSPDGTTPLISWQEVSFISLSEVAAMMNRLAFVKVQRRGKEHPTMVRCPPPVKSGTFDVCKAKLQGAATKGKLSSMGGATKEELSKTSAQALQFVHLSEDKTSGGANTHTVDRDYEVGTVFIQRGGRIRTLWIGTMR